MKQAYLSASMSKDTKTQIGAVLIKEAEIISQGFNGFPRGVCDATKGRMERPIKYSYIVHGEANAILNCARKGASTMGAALYTQSTPCCECAKLIIQAGITKVYLHGPWLDRARVKDRAKWEASSEITKIMFGESGVETEVINEHLGFSILLDGEQYTL